MPSIVSLYESEWRQLMNDPTVVYYSGGWWLVLALVNAGLAEGKGRGRWNWFIISLLLGPIATFLIVTWDRLPSRRLHH